MQSHLRPVRKTVKKIIAISGHFLPRQFQRLPGNTKLRHAAVGVMILGLLLIGMAGTAVAFANEPLICGANGPQTLKPFGDIKNNYETDLKVVGQCDITTDPGQPDPLVYAFHNVNIVNGGILKFHDAYNIDFYAESILVENGGSLVAVSTEVGYLSQISQLAGVLPYTKRLTIHLWGPKDDPGIECVSDLGLNSAPCGIPNTPSGNQKGLWDSNPIMAMDLVMNPPPPPPMPKNAPCVSLTGYIKYLPGNDCFYQYEIQDSQDQRAGRKAYFGHKVLAVSFGGTLQLFGSDGVTYLMSGQKCMPKEVGNECNPANSGNSWRRLTKVGEDTDGHPQLTLAQPKGSAAVNWKKGDRIVVTTTDYLPSHSEVRTLMADAAQNVLTIDSKLEEDHNTKTYSFMDAPASVGPQNDPNVPDIDRAIDTRAVVALLTRNIQVVSEGDTPSEAFEEKPGNFYGGHTIVRQGFLSYQVQGVEFHQLGQGGQIGRYPVHFHMLRKTAQPPSTAADKTPEPLNYLKDCSIDDSMTRWVTVHATQGMYIARNVGYKSIGHGYYLEDATEINNKFYSNVGVFARAAIQDMEHNPRQVPGILADNTPLNPLNPKTGNGDYMPYRSDYNHPTVFWITNGWNDFQYNFAAGAATCGACYWWLGTGVSGPSQYQTWDSYASQQVVTNQPTNYRRAGLAPLANFVGNSCVAAMTSFQMNVQTGVCLGVNPPGDSSPLSAVESYAPPGPPADELPLQPFNVYYPVMTDVHNPSNCTESDCSANEANQQDPPCDALDSHENCAVTHLDHYTSSFNFAQTNFAAIWLRKGWDLVTNSAVTDVQTGGLNFITGGGYTRSDVALGEWLVARNTILVGHSQPPDQNYFASDVGPFNENSGLGCDNSDANRCEYAAGGMSFNLPDYPGQKLVNIYDGPSHQASNAFTDISVSTVPKCYPNSGGSCSGSPVPLARNIGVLQSKTGPACYLPNAAIAWKQPNGFYYPPAFHSRDLWFKNVAIRHFVVEPLFAPIKPSGTNPFVQDQDAVNARYCTRTPVMFSQFNHIDRQTVLNDDDGTLTGLVGAVEASKQPSISINEDPFFDAALTTPECLSDVNVKPPPLPKGTPVTARTSPYEWVTTAIAPQCFSTSCYDPRDNLGHWWIPCTNQTCRGVPLYREYLTSTESSSAPPQIRMMGQATGQRSTLSLNEGAYYLDTTQNCDSQGGCPVCAEKSNDGLSCKTWGPVSSSPTVFVGGKTYYVYLLYATGTTKQKYDIYVSPDATQGSLNIQPVFVDVNNNFKPTTPKDGSFVEPDFSKLSQGILTVTMDLTKQGGIFTATKADFCRPKSYCSYDTKSKTCGCNADNRDCDPKANDCAWAVNDIDCPVDPKNLNSMQCFGFSFTLPENFTPTPMAPPTDLFVPFAGATNSPPYFRQGNVTFMNGHSISPNDTCRYNPVPMQ